MRKRGTWVGGFLLAAGLACGDDGTGPPGQPTIAQATPSGDAQLGAAGAQLSSPLRVTVTQGGAPEPLVTVTWTVTSGGGSVSPATTITGGSGIAQTTWTLGPSAGAQSVQASATGVSGSPVTFTATALVPTASATVSVQNDIFSPNVVLLTVGGTVTFDYPGSARGHNVLPVPPATIPSSPGAPTFLDGPRSFDVTFPSAGTFAFYCSNHGSPGTGMRGQIVVQ
jgi:plastocyanin